jgi:DNA adenine methylase
MAEPILRWAGGKRQMIDEIVSRLPPSADFNEYYESFFGGGAVFFELEPSNGHINDINPTLMNFYEQFRDDLDHIIEENKHLDDALNRIPSEQEKKNFYYTRRREFNELQNGCCEDERREAVLFLFLNRTCWNGLY